MQTPYEILGGEEGVRKLADHFYDPMDKRQEAAHIRKMHGQSLTDIHQKLFEYLCGWLGGPQLYEEKYGTVCITKPHKPYAIGENERDQWLLCMDTALERIGASDELKQMVKEPMFRIADAVRNDRDE